MNIFKWLEANNIAYNNKNVITDAFTHSSYLNENPHTTSEDYERLEFMGDAVLQLWVSKRLFMLDEKLSEGKMTTYRASIVCEEALVSYAKDLELYKYLRLGSGEEKSGGRMRDSILADTFEAFLGAIYIDSGYENASKILELVITFNKVDEIKPAIIDYKTRLQEYIQADIRGSVVYQLVNTSGPANNPVFTIEVYNDSICLGRGVGASKKKAEQNAAKDAFLKLVK